MGDHEQFSSASSGAPAPSTLKRPRDLNDTQSDQLTAIKRAGSAVWRAYQGKEGLRAVFDHDLTAGEAAHLLDRFLSWPQRSRLPSFVKLGRTVRAHRHGILAAFEVGHQQRTY